ncbi:2-dehydropantoate 2-reductase [Phytomonospora endophytica]|uniref:2-dehydropantoate 2-reductase n=1 Tax=Phytomonospora endophytica TaxID=714109 RepID=A0A841FLC9_9ACTN|nr:2-dehydropantoate 2-reductase [Phytomonospora endophytica]MBB6033429.1 2-dehydropantoate 2-reductase [Phytomonospora endophytica]GIG70800.1 2-dehydropantoate 2-reductase [Phytomonospora endophytica]
MKIAVFGAGSIGCHLGGTLAGVAEVTLIGRPSVFDALRAEGLTLTGGGRPETHVPAADLRLAQDAGAASGADYVLVTVKSGATAHAAAELAEAGGDAVVVSFQNGLRNAPVLREGLPGRTVLAGMVPYNVARTAPAAFHQGTSGRLMFDDGPHSAELVAAMRSAGLDVEARGDMPGVQHAKLLMNLNNAVNALSGLPLREQLGRRAYRACLALCQREALAAFRAAGIRPSKMGPLPPGLMPAVLGLPDGLFRRLAASTLRVDAQARSSMSDDLRLGRPTEIAELQGEVVALAGKHGAEAPVNARLAELVREAEGTGTPRTWTGPDLLAELKAAEANPRGG